MVAFGSTQHIPAVWGDCAGWVVVSRFGPHGICFAFGLSSLVNVVKTAPELPGQSVSEAMR